MAAAEAPKGWFCQETTCFLCRGHYRDPVVLQCAHIFCRGCILLCWQDPRLPPSFCPLCQAGLQQVALRPNPQLGNRVDTARQLQDQREAVNWGVCEIHQQPLKFFCKLDVAPICMVCPRFREHKDHPVIPAEAAVEEYKAQIGTTLGSLMKKKKELLAFKEYMGKQGEDLIEQIATERRRTMAVFRDLREFLEEEENRLLAQMEEVANKIAKNREDNIARLSAELSSLEKTIGEMEEKCEQPPRELLKKVKGLFQRYEQKEKFEMPAPFSLALKWRIWDFWEINPVLENVANKFKDTLKNESTLHKEDVTLDSETAHSHLLISKDRKSVTVHDQWHIQPEHIWTSPHYRVVLGSKAFQSGRHYWEVDVGEEEGWMVGIAVANERCNEVKPLEPNASVWAFGKWQGQCWNVFYPFTPTVCPNEEPRKIRVSLNYTGCQVAFFDAETAAMLYFFSIPGHPSSPAYYPFFRLLQNPKLSLGQ